MVISGINALCCDGEIVNTDRADIGVLPRAVRVLCNKDCLKSMSEGESVEFTNMVMVTDPKTGRIAVIKRVRSWRGLAFPPAGMSSGESPFMIPPCVRYTRKRAYRSQS